jgi:hypothetical protein
VSDKGDNALGSESASFFGLELTPQGFDESVHAFQFIALGLQHLVAVKLNSGSLGSCVLHGSSK